MSKILIYFLGTGRNQEAGAARTVLDRSASSTALQTVDAPERLVEVLEAAVPVDAEDEPEHQEPHGTSQQAGKAVAAANACPPRRFNTWTAQKSCNGIAEWTGRTVLLTNPGGWTGVAP